MNLQSTPCSAPLRLMLIPMLALLVGCDDAPDRPAVYPVQGRLSINDEPAEGAIISLHPADGQDFDQRGSRPWATVAADGTFTVSTYGQGDGAPAGEYAVSVVWLDNPNSANPVDRLGGRFARPEQSQWRVTIQDGENVLEPFNIEGVRVPQVRRSPEDSIEPPLEPSSEPVE